MVVVKFGGTSVGAVPQIDQAARIVQSMRDSKPVVVVSAMGGITDALLQAGEAAVTGQTQQRDDKLWEIRSRHDRAINELFKSRDTVHELQDTHRAIWEEIQKVFTGVSLLREMSSRSRDLISSFGERLIVPIFARYLRELGLDAEPVDAREIIVTSEDSEFLLVDFDETRKRCQKLSKMAKTGIVPVVTGFICSTPAGVTTTLGRGGSDYSASIIGSSIKADEIQIWTDVNGVMTANPGEVPEARSLAEISYSEASELAYYGAKVLHYKTILPASRQRIPVRILNSFNPTHPGTRVSAQGDASAAGVKAVTSIRGVILVAINGTGMQGIPGIAAKAFDVVAARQANILMISQASSENNICFVISAAEAPGVVTALRSALEIELLRGHIEEIAAEPVAIVAAVGDRMRGTPGIAATVFTALGADGINVIAISQGSSERNISLVVREPDAAPAVRAIHRAFYIEK